jgi:hypothetical protein
MDRKTLLERGGIGAGMLALPALFGAEAALAGAPPNSRMAWWIVISRISPAVSSPGVWPAIAWSGGVAFRPEQNFIKGGGQYTIVDWNKVPATLPPLASGAWRATEFLGWTTKNLAGTSLPPAGQVQAGVLRAKVELDGIGEADMEFACNVGFAGITTNRPETVLLWNVPGYSGTFDNPATATAASLTSSTIPGYPNVPVTA